MPVKVTLRITKGKLLDQEYVFDERNTCIIGRAKDCSPQLPDDQDHKTISRHHCLLDINPPDVRIRDFGSLNGTFINGRKIGQRRDGQTPEEGAKTVFPEHDLKAGDAIELGNTAFNVSVFIPATCAECSAEIPEDRKAAAERAPGLYQCQACRQKAEAAHRKEPPKKKPKVCARCGRDVSAEIGQNRDGDFVCAACKADPIQIVRTLLELARSGDQDLIAIQGYSVLKELARGGQGAVYLARHDKTGEQVAIKVMLPEVALQEGPKRIFLRETENTKALQHRHIVQVRESGCSQGTFFFTLEYCDGGSVDQLMKKSGGTLPIKEATEIVLQALEGLDYAHHAEIPYVKLADGKIGRGRGLVHRDLKPQNVFLSGAGSSRIAKVGDFGLAKAFDNAGLSGQTRTGSVAGTPFFMPRQQVVNFKLAKPEVDLWAIAATLYHMLTGFVPRDFPKGQDPWYTVLEKHPIPIRQRKASIPAKLAKVIDQALVDQPKIHFTSAAEFKRALESAL